MTSAKTPHVILLLLALSLAACSRPQDTLLTINDADQPKVQAALAKLSEDDRQLVAGYVLRSMMAKGLLAGPQPIPPGTTIGAAISQQKAFVAERQQAEASAAIARAKATAEREAALKTMRDAVSVVLVDKRLVEERGMSGMVLDEKLQVVFGYENKSGKDIAGVKGTIDALDLFGAELSGFNVSSMNDLPANGTSKWTGSRSVKYALGNRKDDLFASLPPEKYTLRWTPEMIVFADGTKLVAPPEAR